MFNNNFQGLCKKEILRKTNQSDKPVEQGGSHSPPFKGRGRGGVCILLADS